MKHLLKEINEIINACEQEHNVFFALAFLHGMKMALMLGLNEDEKQEEKK